MKKFVLLLGVLFSSLAFAKNKDVEIRVTEAVQILQSVAENSQVYRVTPSSDAKKMILELALKEQRVESAVEFNQSWVSEGKAWEVDGSLWGPENVNGAYSYVVKSLRQGYEDGYHSEAKVTESIAKAKKAFGILKTLKSVQYGVAPMGAVQCGVTFPSLLILDTENGIIHQIIMEGSGC